MAFNPSKPIAIIQLIGPGPGTGVIIDFGSGSANAPFGVGVAPFANQTCSNYYDFYSTGGAGWTVVLPINTGLPGCSTNALTARRAFMITDVSQCAPATNTACWDVIPTGQITVNGSNLEITGLSLAGTHIVAGDSSNGLDPTAIQLESLTAAGVPDHLPVVLLALLVISLAGGFLLKRSRARTSA